MGISGQREQFFLKTKIEHEEQQGRFEHIQQLALKESQWMRSAQFESFHPDDLRTLYHLYDEHFLDGLCEEMLGTIPIDFRISSRMTRAGAKTFLYSKRGVPGSERYEIAVAGNLLFDSFEGPQRDIVVCGRNCRSILDALQRLMEHEITHLVELLVWKKSQCSAQRFQSIAANFFGHTDFHHALLTPRQQACESGIHIGTRVRFEFEGRQLRGVVNRITKRATVLVESKQGRPFSDGRKYETYYIPLPMLQPVDP